MNDNTRVDKPISTAEMREMFHYSLRTAERFKGFADTWKDEAHYWEGRAAVWRTFARNVIIFYWFIVAILVVSCVLGCHRTEPDPAPPQAIESVAIDGPTEIITVPHSILFHFDRAPLGEPAPGWMSTGPDNSMDEAPGLHVVKVDPLNPDNKCYGTTSEEINIHAHYMNLRIQLERMLALESAQTEFSVCLQGPSVIPPVGDEGELHSCVLHCDMDGDGDVDLFDFAVFQDEVDNVMCEPGSTGP